MAPPASSRRPRPRLRQLTSGELAGLCGISKRSVVKAIADGRLRAARTVGGHYRISPDVARTFMAARGLDTSALAVREDCALVVARDKFVRDLLADVLGRSGMEMVQASDLFDAGVLCCQHRPALVVIDAATAGPEAAEVCRRAVRSAPCRGARVLVLATRGTEGTYGAGACGVLSKPFSVAELKAILKEMGVAAPRSGRVQ